MNYDFNITPSYKEDGRKWYQILEHQLVWMIANGKTIPPGYDIHHLDGNKENNDSDNLVCIPHDIHFLYHYSNRNKSGIMRVHKHTSKSCNQGYTWSYKYIEDGETKRINSISLKKLQKKVKDKGLPWLIINPLNALKSYRESEENNN